MMALLTLPVLVDINLVGIAILDHLSDLAGTGGGYKGRAAILIDQGSVTGCSRAGLRKISVVAICPSGRRAGLDQN